MFRPLFVGAVIVGVLASSLAHAQTAAGDGFPLMAADALRVISSGGRVVAMTRTSMDTTLLAVHDARTGNELLRTTAQPEDRIAFNGRYLVRATRDAVFLIDIDSHEERPVVETKSAGTVDAV